MHRASMARSGELVGLGADPLPGVQVSRRFPPARRQRAGGLSGRPSCRIYLRQLFWVLEWERASGAWMECSWGHEGNSYVGGPPRLTFPTLSAAIGYAERHGLDYRVIPPPPRPTKRRRRRMPASWLARRARSRRGDGIYHA